MMPFSTSFRSLSIFLPIHAHMYLTHTTHIYMAFPIKLPECDNIILRVSAYRKLPYYKILIYLLIFFPLLQREREKNDSFGGSCQKMFSVACDRVYARANIYIESYAAIIEWHEFGPIFVHHFVRPIHSVVCSFSLKKRQ